MSRDPAPQPQHHCPGGKGLQLGSEAARLWLPFYSSPGATWALSALTNGLTSPLPLSSGVFEVAEASGVRTGTKIIIHLKADSREFASEARVRGEHEPGPPGQAWWGLRVTSSSQCSVVSLATCPA